MLFLLNKIKSIKNSEKKEFLLRHLYRVWIEAKKLKISNRLLNSESREEKIELFSKMTWLWFSESENYLRYKRNILTFIISNWYDDWVKNLFDFSERLSKANSWKTRSRENTYSYSEVTKKNLKACKKCWKDFYWILVEKKHVKTWKITLLDKSSDFCSSVCSHSRDLSKANKLRIETCEVCWKSKTFSKSGFTVAKNSICYDCRCLWYKSFLINWDFKAMLPVKSKRVVTKEQRERRSKFMIEKIRNSPEHYIHRWNSKYVKNILWERLLLRSSYEVILANFLNSIWVVWNNWISLSYEFDWTVRSYFPDFYLQDFNFFIEVKWYFHEKDKLKMKNVILQNNVEIWLFFCKEKLLIEDKKLRCLKDLLEITKNNTKTFMQEV